MKRCFKAVFTILTSALTILGSQFSHAAQPADVVTFHDSNLEAAVREALAIPVNAITFNDMLALTSLDARDRQIADTTGLEAALNLTNLVLNSNPVTDYSGFQGLTNLLRLEFNNASITNAEFLLPLIQLEELQVYGNHIEDAAPLGQLSRLRYLQLDWNPVTNHTPLAGLTNLTRLSVAGNGIRQLDFVVPLQKLESLGLYDDSVQDISTLTNLTQLRELGLGWNGVTNANRLAEMPQLENLYLDGNALTNVSFLSGMTNLTGLSLAYTELADMSPITNLTKLTWVNVGENHLQSLPDLSSLTNLDTFMTAGNQIEDISPVTSLPSLRNLHLQRNPFQDLSPVTGCPQLEILLLAENTVTDLSVIGELTNLRELQMENMNLTDPSQLDFIAALPNLWQLNLAFNRLGDLSPLTNSPNLGWLSVEGNHLFNIEPLLNAPGLWYVNLLQNYLDTTETSAAWNVITNLEAHGVGVDYDPQNPPPVFPTIVSQPSSKAVFPGDYVEFQVLVDGGTPWPSFRWLKDGIPLSDNARRSGTESDTLQINDVEAADAGDYSVQIWDEWITTNSRPASLRVVTNVAFLDSSLEQAIRDRLGIPSAPVTPDDLRNLDWLDAYDRGITNLSGIESCANLRSLSLNSNPGITDFSPLAALANLTYLDLNNCAVGNMDFIAGLPFLDSLHVWGGTFTDISPLLNKPGMLQLNLGGNTGITNLEVLNSLTNMENMALDGTGISNIAFIVFMPNLISLNLSDNALEDISLLSTATNLTSLELWRNQIVDATPLAACVKLDWLIVGGNQIADLGFASGLTNLSFLDANSNPFSDVSPLAGLTNLINLNVGDSLVTDLGPIANLTLLRGFDMWNLGVSDVGFLASLTSLEGLGAGNNHISTFTAYPSLSHLRYLNLSGNPLASVSFIHDLPSLRELHVNAIGLSNLTPFTGRTNLEVLSLAGNGISDISPLATLPRLTWLSFWDNRLQDISALAGLTNLNYVDLRYNQLNTGSGSAARTVIALLQARAATVDYDPQNSPTSLVADAHTLALYHFDGAAAGTDSSGHGYDLAFTGGRGLTNGIFNEALLLPDMNAVSATRPGDDAAFDFGSGDFTVELFVKFNGFDHEQTLVEKWVGASGPGWTFTCIGAHLLRFHLDTTVYLDVDPNLETNTWYHLAAQRHGSSLTIWRDGVQLGEFTTSATATDTSMPLLIGKRNSDGQSFPMNGAIDEVRISSVARYGTVNVQPFITENPANQTVAAGSNAQFKVSAVGLGTLNYQWRKNGTNLAAATDDTLAISNARWADEAGYDVVISSGALSVTSRVATLEVIYSSGPVITYNATDDFTIANGNPNGLWSYGWMPTDFSAFNLYVNHGNIANGSGPMWHGWNGDLTPCLWKNLGGSAYGVPNGWLSLHPGPGTQPSVLRWTAPVAGKVNVTGQFLPGDGGYMQVAVRLNNAQWWHVGNSGSFDLTTNVAAGSTIDFAVYGGYGYGNTPVSASISYLDATTDFPPSITQQPQSQLAHVGNDVSFSVAANGTTPFAYQWRKGGSDLSSATNATLTVTNVQPSDAGDYDVIVANTSSVTSRVATLTVDFAADVSVNISAPATITIGSNLTCVITVTNAGPSPAADVVLTNLLPANAAVISVIATQGGWVQQGNLITASLGTLARGASASLTTIVTPASLGTITNIAGVKSTATDPNPADNVATLAVTVSLPEQSVLFVNVNGSYDGDGNSIYQTLLWAGAQATWVHLDANGKVAALLQTNHYDQIWVYDLSTGADNYPADWQAIADWFNARASRTLICDGRIISSYWSGRYNSEGKRLTKNYYENFKTFGGGLLLGTDHSAYQPGINNINDAINVQRFSGNFNLSSIPVDTNSPLMAIPNNLGGALSDDSSPGQAPFGLQPGGLILYSVAWHSGNTNTPGISTTIRGGVGFRTLIAAPANNSTFNEDSAVTFQAQPLNGVAPFTFQWTSDRDGLFATGMVAQVSNLSTGLHRITLVGTESGGGADSDSIQVTIQPVTAAITMNLRSGDDSGASTNDFITSVATPVFEVTINKRGQIEFDYTGDGTADEVRANLTPGVHEFTPPVLADGSHNFTARFVPLRGNPVEASATVTIDTHGPRIAAMEPAAGSALSHGLDHVDLTFDEAIDSASFTAADVALSGPGGSFAATGVSVLSSNQFRVSFPAQAAIGAYTLTFGPGIADVAGNLMNQNSNATNGEAADAFTTALTIALPDLAIVALTAPATAQPEVPFELAWTVTNRGNAVTTGPWTETLFVSNSVSGVQTLAGFTGSSALAPGASATRTQSITLPANGPAGELHFSVVADSGNVVAEIDEANNSLAAPNTTTVPLKLKLELSATEVAENAVSPVQATVTRNGDRSAALTVTLGNSGPAHLNSPASVEISAGQASATFNIQPLHDGLVTGSQHVKVTASATGFTGGNQTLTVLDVDQPNFMLVISTNTMLEGRTVGAVISRGLVTTNPLTVVFGSSDPNRLVVPDSVVIPANADSASFAILAKDNTLIEPPQNYTISASAPGFTTTGTSVTVNDDDTPQVTVTLADHIVSESAGPQATTATITRDPVATRSVLVELFSSNTNTAQVPAQVIIPANKPSVTFNVSAVNDPNLTGSKSVSIGGYVIATVSSARVSNITPDTLTVTDDSSPSLQIAFAQKIVKEGADPATTVTVTRNTPATNDLVVTLSSSDTNKLVVPATVTITNGQSSVEFSVATISDNLNTGNATVTVTASAAGFASAAGNLTVTDVDLPDLAIAGITLPAAADTESSTTVSYRIVNQGLAAVGTNFLTRVFLSADPLGNTSTLIGQYRFPGPLPVGGQFEMSSPVQLPQKAGDYWIVVQTDVEGNVTEGLKDNNTGISKTAIRANAAYAAWVQVSPPKLWLAGTPVSMSGRATNHLGAGVASKLVNIHVVLRGTDRVISALTDANGYFSTTFQPLANEAGSYQVFATHPGVPTGTAQDAFTLLGMRVNPVVTSASFDEQSGTSGSIAIENLSDTPLTGLSATVMSKPDGLNVGINLSGTTINGSGTVSLGYTLNAATTTGSGVVHVHLRTTEGVEGEAYFTVQVIALRPKLVADPAQLIAGMVGGKQVTLQFNITNAGAIATGPITVSLPSVAWMQLASTNPMPSLAPGETNQVTLVLTPPVGLPLGPYSGNLALNCTGDSLSVPFTFRCLSEASGELVVSAVDEYTFYAAGSPKLTNATVVVRDAFNHAVVTNGVTGADGSFHAGALLEGYYEISVSAPKHNGYSGSRFVTAGVTNEVEAFLNLQTVQYVWTVEPTEIEDRTKITIETVFETYVPAPVVTIEPALIDLAEIKGNEAQVNLKISNHGLIAAKDFKLNMPTHDLWEFTPLISDVGNIPAQSTLTVPLTIRRIVPGSPKAMAKASAKDSGSDCNTAGDGCFHFDCGRYSFTVCLPVNFINTDDDCSRPSVPGLPFVFNPGGFGTPTGGPSGGSSGPAGTGRIDIPQTFSVKSCEDCVNSLAKAMFDCFIGFTPESWVRDGFKCAYSSANVIASPNDSLGWAGAFLDCASAFGHAAPGVGQVLGVLSCLNGLISACLNEPGSGPDVGAKLALLRDSHVLAAKIPDQFRDRVPEGLLRKFPAMATLTERADRVATYPKLLDTILGDDAWLNSNLGTNFTACLGTFSGFTSPLSDGGARISNTESNQLTALPLPDGVTTANFTKLIERWNRSQDYYAAGIYNLADVPAGQSTDFIAYNSFTNAAGAFIAAENASRAEGFTNSYAALQDAYVTLKNQVEGYSESGSGTCAKVKLVLNQEAVISRDAFNATLQVINGSDSQLQDVSVELKIVSTNGVSSIGAFGIRPPTLVSLSAVDGTGLIDPQTTGEASWIIIPGSDAAPEAPTVYYVSGTLKYSQDGLLVTVPLAAVPITVYPNPKLYIKYFHQRDVYADDPFTTEFEPSIPFNLAVMVENRGKGTARNMRITSSQPKIVENDKGLLIDFQIIGTEVAGQNTTPSLTVNFGNIGPSGIAIGRWLMTSTLQGLFEDYKATFENVDDLGNKKLSLIDEVTIHEMIHLVQAPGSFEDGKPDFLVNDVFDTRDLPDTLYLSDGTTNPVSVAEESIVDAPPSASHPEVQLTAPMQAGWTYLRVPEPGDGQYQLTRVVRSDGVEIYFNTNAWTTDRTFIGMGRKPVRENILHLLDYNSTGVYTLYYGTPPAADTNAPASSVVALPAKSSPTFVVQWSATDDGGVAGCDLYVSTNGGPFGLWLSNTKLVSTLFTGAYGSTYSFYSVARDYAGNTEPAPALPDAITRVTPTIIAVADALGIKQDKTTVASAVKLLANDTDSAGSPLSVTGVISPSANGGSVSLSGGLIRYTPPVGFIGQDSFAYEVSDALGGYALGTVLVTVTSSNAPSQNVISITRTESNWEVKFAGIPGRAYLIQAADSVSGPWANLSDPIVADATGMISFTDNTTPVPQTRFYRTIAISNP